MTTISSDYQRIKNPLGLHLRAARKLVEVANHFEASVEVEKKGGPRINAKSILGVLLLEGVQGTEIRVLATGIDAREAVASMTSLIDSGFGEL